MYKVLTRNSWNTLANKPEAKEYGIEHDAKNTNVSPMHCAFYISRLMKHAMYYVSDVEIRKATGRKTYNEFTSTETTL